MGRILKTPLGLAILKQIKITPFSKVLHATQGPQPAKYDNKKIGKILSITLLSIKRNNITVLKYDIFNLYIKWGVILPYYEDFLATTS